MWAFDFDPTGNYFISGSDDNSLVLWKRFYGPSRLRKHPFALIWRNADSLSASILAVKYEPLQRIWNAHNRAIYSVSWYPEGGLISEQDEFDAESLKRRLSSHMFVASGSSDRSIAIWSAKCIPKEVRPHNQLAMF